MPFILCGGVNDEAECAFIGFGIIKAGATYCIAAERRARWFRCRQRFTRDEESRVISLGAVTAFGRDEWMLPSRRAASCR